ncbi:hypothetical protein LIER_41254 [Lithospermum erythrorhizon]|uniref:RNase H type-1 domain-containing protein n=1 Tax=Lithospermum erythrorhizon TaxID=34254 RepID=A0AAV3R7X8_LITER
MATTTLMEAEAIAAERILSCWKLKSIIMRISNLLEDLGATIYHIWREQNKVADHMAKVASRHGLEVVWREEEISSDLRALVILEKQDCPYLRRH